jgi:hypothetical protein
LDPKIQTERVSNTKRCRQVRDFHDRGAVDVFELQIGDGIHVFPLHREDEQQIRHRGLPAVDPIGVVRGCFDQHPKRFQGFLSKRSETQRHSVDLPRKLNANVAHTLWKAVGFDGDRQVRRFIITSRTAEMVTQEDNQKDTLSRDPSVFATSSQGISRSTL